MWLSSTTARNPQALHAISLSVALALLDAALARLAFVPGVVLRALAFLLDDDFFIVFPQTESMLQLHWLRQRNPITTDTRVEQSSDSSQMFLSRLDSEIH